MLLPGCKRSHIVDEGVMFRVGIKKYSLIIDSQHGFRQGRSCLTNLLKFLEELSSYIDQGYPLDVIYLDFSKAFNKVTHQRLMSMIEAHGISGAVSRWIKAWLNDRKHIVVVKRKGSYWNCHLNVRKYFFSQRVVDEWNSLPNKAVDTNSVNGFKNQIDPILRKKGGFI